MHGIRYVLVLLLAIGLLCALQVGPHTVDQIASGFKRKPTKAAEQILQALHVVLGQAQKDGDRWRLN